ncbi:MAG: hypothetical protein HQ515_24930 [Phycisphaeraceae bacterium]|nr:hypothetical protein [Phycisphaeraceae bacterium]
MKLGKRKLSGREKDEAAIELLVTLREQLHSTNTTVARQTAFNLSWLQEDGFDILKEAMFLSKSKRTKNAATYGLRKMRGRMAKPGLALIEEGANGDDPVTAEICKSALDVYHNRHKPRRPVPQKKRASRFEIRDVPSRGSRRRAYAHRGGSEVNGNRADGNRANGNVADRGPSPRPPAGKRYVRHDAR